MGRDGAPDADARSDMAGDESQNDGARSEAVADGVGETARLSSWSECAHRERFVESGSSELKTSCGRLVAPDENGLSRSKTDRVGYGLE